MTYDNERAFRRQVEQGIVRLAEVDGCLEHTDCIALAARGMPCTHGDFVDVLVPTVESAAESAGTITFWTPLRREALLPAERAASSRGRTVAQEAELIRVVSMGVLGVGMILAAWLGYFN